MVNITLRLKSPVHFNDYSFTHVSIDDHAMKHFSVSHLIEIANYVPRTLNGQNIQYTRVDPEGKLHYFFISCIGTDDINVGVTWEFTKFRTTEFLEDRNNNKLILVHASPRKKKQYDRLSKNIPAAE